VFQDERAGPQQPVRCGHCGVTVLVCKNSLAHTVVQWTSSTDTCAELAGSFVRACPFLADSIDAAVRAGVLQVADQAVPARD
jgi:hypothetical protein